MAVGQCWNVGSLSTDALGTTVVVAVAMQEPWLVQDSLRENLAFGVSPRPSEAEITAGSISQARFDSWCLTP